MSNEKNECSTSTCYANDINHRVRTTSIIERPESKWAAILVPVKKDNTIRLCWLSEAQCHHEDWPLPNATRVDDIIAKVGRARYISTIDMMKRYWQVPVHEEDRSKNVCDYIWTLPIYKNAVWTPRSPSYFQRMVDQLLNGLSEFSSHFYTKKNHPKSVQQDMKSRHSHKSTQKGYV